jgi:hypothetical protein
VVAYTTIEASPGAPITDLVAQLVQVANGDTCEVGGGNLFYVLNNGGGVSTTATITTPGAVGGLAIADVVLTVAAGDIGIVPLPMEILRGPTNRATIATFTATTTVTGGVIRLGGF